MIEGIFGKKIGMTHVFAEDGAEIPVTVIKTGPCYVVARKVSSRDGYEAVQLGIGDKKEKNTSAAMKKVFANAKTPNLAVLGEFKCLDTDEYKPGSIVKCEELFQAGDFVDVTGKTKGKGFAGGMKRWGFHGGPGSHGSMHGRAPGSIGQSAWPSRVMRGLKMAGHMGSRNRTTQNLKIVAIRAEEGLVLIKGAVPGAVNGLVRIQKARKKTSAPKGDA
ncbi:MAG: 50S ribosomal protein L3 [Thermodesulfobacteriota bacterium]